MNNLGTYLNDHLAGSVAAIELIDHLIKEQTGLRLEKFLVDLRDEISADQETLRDLIRKLDCDESTTRKASAWFIEKIGQTKIALAGNNASDLGLLQALEGLALGITGKKSLWNALQTIEADVPELQGLNLERLEHRAQSQFESVERERLHLARETLRSNR